MRTANALLSSSLYSGVLCVLLVLSTQLNLPGAFLAGGLIAFVTLIKGWRFGAVVLSFAALPAISLLVLHRGWDGIYDMLLLRCVLVFALACGFRQSVSWRLLLEISALLGVGLVILAHLLIPHLTQFWVTWISQVVTQYDLLTTFHLDPKTLNEVVLQAASLATGSFITMLTLGALLQLLLGRYAQSLLQKTDLFQELAYCRVSRGLAVVCIVIGALAVFKVPIMMDALPVILLPFGLVGLSVLHAVLHQRRFGWLALMLIYVSLIWLSFVVMAIFVLLGYLETWFNLREKLSQ